MCKTTDIIDTRLWQKLSARIHKDSVSKGFWDEDHPLNHCFMLVVCELCEAIEADRKGRYAKKNNCRRSALRLCVPNRL